VKEKGALVLRDFCPIFHYDDTLWLSCVKTPRRLSFPCLSLELRVSWLVPRPRERFPPFFFFFCLSFFPVCCSRCFDFPCWWRLCCSHNPYKFFFWYNPDPLCYHAPPSFFVYPLSPPGCWTSLLSSVNKLYSLSLSGLFQRSSSTPPPPTPPFPNSS